MQKNEAPVIDVKFVVVDDCSKREPIISSWVGLWWFIIPPLTILTIRYAQIKGWL